MKFKKGDKVKIILSVYSSYNGMLGVIKYVMGNYYIVETETTELELNDSELILHSKLHEALE